MSNPYFEFKQFTIFHDNCAMKVGTDAVLLGAWTDVTDKTKALDVGTGTGILALMIAQRNNSIYIKAIDNNSEAVVQARKNIISSPFAERISVEQHDFKQMLTEGEYDLIVCNPPYFEEEVYSPTDSRNEARHTSALPFELMVKNVSSMLNAGGVFSVIIPTTSVDRFCKICSNNGFYLKRRTDVQTTSTKMPKRTMLEFLNVKSILSHNTLIIRNSDNTYSEHFIQLTKDFYLNM